MSSPNPDRNRFDIHGFDASLLDIDQIKQQLRHFRDPSPTDPTTTPAFTQTWQITHSKQGTQSDIYYFAPDDPDTLPALCVKYGHTAGATAREYAVLAAIHDFGFSIGPRPFYRDEHLLITEWLFGKVFDTPPDPTADGQWHRVMAMLGVPWNMPFAKYASQVAMHGTAPQSPGEVFPMLDAQLAELDVNHPDYEQLARLVERVKQQVAPQWNSPALITLNHLDPQPHHFLWDGAHMRLVGWQSADWADKAFAVGQLCAHPQYVHLPPQHWVWYRWELSRLDRDPTLRARATTYTNMMLVYWAIRRTAELVSAPVAATTQHGFLQQQRDLYLQRASSAFV